MRYFMEKKLPLNNDEHEKKPLFFQKRDAILVLVILVIAAAIFAFYQFTKEKGATAVITVGLNTQTQEIFTYPLNEDQRIDLTGGKLPVHLQIENDKIRFINSECSDHNCEGFGWLQNQGEWAACLPAGVVVQIQSNK